jgi:hypothetical protein
MSLNTKIHKIKVCADDQSLARGQVRVVDIDMLIHSNAMMFSCVPSQCLCHAACKDSHGRYHIVSVYGDGYSYVVVQFTPAYDCISEIYIYIYTYRLEDMSTMHGATAGAAAVRMHHVQSYR